MVVVMAIVMTVATVRALTLEMALLTVVALTIIINFTFHMEVVWTSCM